jgi:hypothetical protein
MTSRVRHLVALGIAAASSLAILYPHVPPPRRFVPVARPMYRPLPYTMPPRLTDRHMPTYRPWPSVDPAMPVMRSPESGPGELHDGRDWIAPY